MEQINLLRTEFIDLFIISLRSSKLYTFLRFVFPIIESCIIIFMSYLGKLVIDDLTSNNFHRAIYIVIIFTILQILNLIITKYNNHITMLHNDLISNSIKKDLMSVALDMDIQWFDEPELQNKFSKIQNDIFELSNLVWSIFDFIRSIISLVISLIIFLNINMYIGFIIIITSIPVAISDKKYANTIFNWQKDNMKLIRKLSYFENMSYDKYFSEEVRLYDLSNKIKEKYDDTWHPYYKGKKTILSHKTRNNSLCSSFPHFFVLLFMIILIIKIQKGTATIGDYSFYSNIVYQIIISVSSVISNFIALYENRLIVNNISTFLTTNNINKIKSGNKELDDLISLEFKNVSFVYPNTEKKVLDNISFKVNSGDTIVLVGINGSGKTTILKLLLRLYDVTDGEILVNGLNIKEFSISSLHKLYSVLFQNYISYSLSLRENINLFNNNPDMDLEIVDIMNSINANEILDKANAGLSTNLTKMFDENGIELSGGEFQKLALCRAIFSAGKVFLLDEPTSALDPESENELLEYINNLQSKKTTFLVSHRLSNIHTNDHILLIENGKIIEDGTHKELMKIKGRYHQLYMYQAEKYNVK